jgi:hypothetical protein
MIGIENISMLFIRLKKSRQNKENIFFCFEIKEAFCQITL